MKNILTIILLLAAFNVFAQVKTSYVLAKQIEVATNKTINLIFPFSITHVDRGSQDILAQQIENAPNVLELKAAIDSFVETNLSVITADGSLYCFDVRYAADPGRLNIVLQKEKPVAAVSNNEEQYNKAATYILKQSRCFYGVADKHDEIRAVLYGLYVQNDILYFDIKLSNYSNVSYGIDALHCTIKDKQKSKRTATQELPLQPVFVTGLQQSIRADTAQHIVFALPKFTLPDNKYLLLQITEKTGGRDISLRVKNRHLLRAKILTDAD
ncbi:MAG TPA: conjugative transposon protein TraN [Chitinophagaceae bacterium]|nr:conjugative transposon protein TraN [Chitinophagaceae bacterium]